MPKKCYKLDTIKNSMLSIRFFRVGKKNKAFFKLVVNDKRRSAKAGKFLEDLGYYNPITKEKSFKADRIKYWIAQGAEVTATVNNLLVKEKVIEGKKVANHSIRAKKEEAK